MLFYIIRRIITVIPLLFVLSLVSFIIIQLPPGSFLDTYISTLKLSGTEVSDAEIARLIKLYDLDKPMYVQYFTWIKNIVLHGDLGRSFQWNRPVKQLIGDRIGLTMLISILTILFTWIIAVPIGIYSALHQYSLFDYFFTFLGFIGLALPGFWLHS